VRQFAAVVGALAKVKSFLDTGQFMAVQKAGIAALESWASWVPGNVAVFKERRDAAVAPSVRTDSRRRRSRPRPRCISGCRCPSHVPSMAFHERCMQEEGVIVLAGAALGAGGEGSSVSRSSRVRYASPRRQCDAGAC
jgi:LL-diaminopimelate aminotransferase